MEIEKRSKKLKQKRQHGCPTFPFEIYETCIPEQGFFYRTHYHSEIEFVFMHRGRCDYYIEGEKLVLESGNMLMISPDVIHSFNQHENEGCYATVLIFDLNLISNKVDLASQNYFIPMINGRCNTYATVGFNDKHYSEYCRIVESLLVNFLTRTMYFELKVKRSLIDMFILLMEDGKLTTDKKSADSVNYNIIQRVIGHIEEHHNEDITLEELSRVADVSVYRLSHMFKDITGKSCIDYVIDYRLSVIADLLKTSDEPITEIAVKNGFNNISNFNYAFKKKYKTTPSQYRKNRKSQL